MLLLQKLLELLTIIESADITRKQPNILCIYLNAIDILIGNTIIDIEDICMQIKNIV
jgi:hypothetical protein